MSALQASLPRAPIAAFLLAFAVIGCASTDAGRAPTRARSASGTPWLVPREEHDTQRLFRTRLESREGRGRFRLLLRLRDPARYQIRATHPLFNRRLWSLDVDGSNAVLVDHHQRTACRYQDQAEIGAIPLGPFPFASLPALLLGYLPLPPSSSIDRGTPGLVSYDDALGRRWTAELHRGTVHRWQVSGEEIGTVAWRITDQWAVLTADAEELDLRWKETLRETLSEPMGALEIPAGYSDGPCDLGWLKAVEDAPWEDAEGDADPDRR